MKNEEQFSIYMALDGPHIDGLIGSAGIMRFDWPEREFYIQHYEGISAAHNVSLAPNGKLALLGNFSQQNRLYLNLLRQLDAPSPARIGRS